jgi:raffinose/stachyose/melibiose transport system permease protein
MPFFLSIFNSLFSWKQFSRADFTGLENFRTLFTVFPYMERFFNALMNNAKWFVITMILQNSLGLYLGYMLARRFPGQEFFKRVFFFPVLFSIAAVSFLWSLYLKPYGLVNEFLKLAGLGILVFDWLGDARVASYAIIAVNIWRWIGFPSLVFFVAVDSVPVECIEAAYLDGIGEWKMFWRIIFPQILPVVAVMAVITFIGSLNVLEQVFIMAGPEGQPGFSTDTLATLFYRTAFGGANSAEPAIGIGSAIGVIIYLSTFIISMLFIVAARPGSWNYDD